jgi:hypothetical protein
MGETFYRVDNPDVAATITYYIKDEYKSIKQERIKSKNEENYQYPSFEQLSKEDKENAPYLLFTIKDMNGNIVRRLESSYKSGINQIKWDLKYADTRPIDAKVSSDKYSGMPVLPGDYTVEIHKVIDGSLMNLIEPKKFKTVTINEPTLVAEDKSKLLDMQHRAFKVRKAITGTNNYISAAENHLKILANTVVNYAESNLEYLTEIKEANDVISEIELKLNGNSTKKKRNAAYVIGLNDRLGNLLYGFWYSTSAPTKRHLNTINLIESEFNGIYNKLSKLDNSIKKMSKNLNDTGSPWVPGQLPKLD